MDLGVYYLIINDWGLNYILFNVLSIYPVNMEWAVPINPTCLSTHLQVYIKMKRTVTTLLLYYWFG
jgi:hypothetical protein